MDRFYFRFANGVLVALTLSAASCSMIQRDHMDRYRGTSILRAYCDPEWYEEELGSEFRYKPETREFVVTVCNRSARRISLSSGHYVTSDLWPNGYNTAHIGAQIHLAYRTGHWDVTPPFAGVVYEDPLLVESEYVALAPGDSVTYTFAARDVLQLEGGAEVPRSIIVEAEYAHRWEARTKRESWFGKLGAGRVYLNEELVRQLYEDRTRE